MTGLQSTSVETGLGPCLRSFPKAGLAVVFGASGGIGRALVELLRSTDGFDQVIGLSRTSSPPVELLDEASLEHAAAFVAARGEPRLVIELFGTNTGFCSTFA